jgi:hypothetical protein
MISIQHAKSKFLNISADSSRDPAQAWLSPRSWDGAPRLLRGRQDETLIHFTDNHLQD